MGLENLKLLNLLFTQVYDGTMEMELNYENGYGFEQFGFKMLGKAHIADGLWEMSLMKTRGYGEGIRSVFVSVFFVKLLFSSLLFS